MKQTAVWLIIITTVFLLAACLNDQQIEFQRAYTAGEVVYYQHCRNCHGDKGEGLSALMPPLTDSVYLRKNTAELSCIVKYGLNNKMIIINKRPYQNQMPASSLAPIEIAQVLTYLKNTFGNKQGIVTVTRVNSDLAKCK